MAKLINKTKTILISVAIVSLSLVNPIISENFSTQGEKLVKFNNSKII